MLDAGNFKDAIRDLASDTWQSGDQGNTFVVARDGFDTRTPRAKLYELFNLQAPGGSPTRAEQDELTEVFSTAPRSQDIVDIEEFNPSDDKLVVLLQGDSPEVEITIEDVGPDAVVLIDGVAHARVKNSAHVLSAHHHVHVLGGVSEAAFQAFAENGATALDTERLLATDPELPAAKAGLTDIGRATAYTAYDETDDALVVLYDYGTPAPTITVTHDGKGVYTVYADGHPMIVAATKGAPVTAGDIFVMERAVDGSVPLSGCH